MIKELQQLKNELQTELFSILAFWKSHSIDTQNGGFIGAIDGNNNPQPNASKGVVLNARLLWTFSSAYAVYGNTNEFEMANRAYDFLIDFFTDKKYGGVFWELDNKGMPLNTRKQIYGLAFAIYGLAAYYKIKKQNEVLKYAIILFDLIEKHSFDTLRNGYIEALTREWNRLDDYRLSEKDANESKTMNTHLHILEGYTNLYRIWKDEKLAKALKNLIELFLDKFINSSYHLNLFFDDEWNLKSDEISYGHDIECSWLLYEAAEVLGNKDLLEKTQKVASKMAIENMEGLDTDGGLIYERFPTKNKTDTDKHWWPQAEAMVGYFNAYQISGHTLLLEKTISTWNFIKNYMIDKEHGEWYWRVNTSGKPYKSDEKAGFWKCPYHNSRACIEIIERINKINNTQNE